MSTVTVTAVDLGASSGRVMLGRVGADTLKLTEVHRFPNIPVTVDGTLHWDIMALLTGVLRGLRSAGQAADLASIGIDSWAVDYGLLDERGVLLQSPVHYRDRRTDGIMTTVLTQIDAGDLYETTGLQQLPFNTLYQLIAEIDAGRLERAHTLLLIPDLIAYWLTGQIGAEATNASTTQLYHVRRREWARELIQRFDLPDRIFPEIREPGSRIGTLLSTVAEQTGLTQEVPVTAIGSHDTASAVAAIPVRTERFAYISCGTWSLVGLELDYPVLTEASRQANFTNEAGVDGRIRYLRNVMGLWLLQESIRTWESQGQAIDLDSLLAQAAAARGFQAVIDPNNPDLLPPGDMPARVADACRRTNQPVPQHPAGYTRCILDSLALAHRHAIQQAQELSGQEVDVIHIVGGGARNALLCQLTADACRLPVLAGPVEATALGNTLVQARTLGAIGGDLDQLRTLVVDTQPVVRYDPRGHSAAWAAAEERALETSKPHLTSTGLAAATDQIVESAAQPGRPI